MLLINELLAQVEGKTLEFKRDLSSPDKVIRTVVAFANGAGGTLLLGIEDVYMANCRSSGDWQFKQPVAMALPTVILKVGCLRCWVARFFTGGVAV